MYDQAVCDRFWSRVNKDGPLPEHAPALGKCWTWTRGRFASGYGEFCIARKQPLYAHRVAWQMTNGPIPRGLCVCHRCDNPPCVNPSHLFVGSIRDNARDAASKGRMAHGERSGTSKLLVADVTAIRALYANGCTMNELASQFHVAETTIWYIVRGVTWRAELSD